MCIVTVGCISGAARLAGGKPVPLAGGLVLAVPLELAFALALSITSTLRVRSPSTTPAGAEFTVRGGVDPLEIEECRDSGLLPWII